MVHISILYTICRPATFLQSLLSGSALQLYQLPPSLASSGTLRDDIIKLHTIIHKYITFHHISLFVFLRRHEGLERAKK